MEIPAATASLIYDEIGNAKEILIISHRNPDADTVGSNLALRIFAAKKGKKVTSACVDPVDCGCSFLPDADAFVKEFKSGDFDLVVSVDCGSVAQTVFAQKNPRLLKKMINIDHHSSNNNFGTVNLVISSAASTTQIIFNLFKTWNEKICGDIATCLLCGLYSDTGSFMHSNTCEEVYETAGELTALGARRNLIVKNLFKRSSYEKLKLLGRILNETQLTDKKVVISAVKKEDLTACQADLNDISGAIDYLNCVKGNRIAALLTEDGKGFIRGSLRTRHDDINLSDIAGNLGGGGHKKASGFTVKGKLEKEVRWVIKRSE